MAPRTLPLSTAEELNHDHPTPDVSPRRSERRFGPWSCKNALAEALTCRDLGEVAVHGHFPDVAAFPTAGAADADFSGPGRLSNSGQPHVGGDYALIAAMSGWTPMMFMTRVRL